MNDFETLPSIEGSDPVVVVSKVDLPEMLADIKKNGIDCYFPAQIAATLVEIDNICKGDLSAESALCRLVESITPQLIRDWRTQIKNMGDSPFVSGY